MEFNAFPNRINKKATTFPPKIIDLKFKPLNNHYNDGDETLFDFIELTFVYDADDKDSRSDADQFLIETYDIEAKEYKGYIQNAREIPYTYWQRSIEVIAEFEEAIGNNIEGGITSAKVRITPINDKGFGKRSIFFLPLKNMNYISDMMFLNNPAMLVLSKFWHLYSPTPDIIKNRPKYMYVYIDVPPDDVYLDKQFLSGNEWDRTLIGNWNDTNQNTYRWILYEGDHLKIDENDALLEMTSEEIEFIRHLLNSINDILREYLNLNKIDQGEQYIFKVAIKNPLDHKDSIVLYLMRGKRWEI